MWSRNFGETFISDAFKLAHVTDPSAKLYLNEYGIANINAKSDGVYNMVKRMRSEGVPIHGVGFQTHMTAGDNIGTFEANIKRFAEMGVDVAVTEMDVKIKLPSNQATFEIQGKNYGDVVKSCLAVKGCVGVTFWGFTDKHSWIPHAAPGYGDALLWDKDYKPKPAAYAVEAALK